VAEGVSRCAAELRVRETACPGRSRSETEIVARMRTVAIETDAVGRLPGYAVGLEPGRDAMSMHGIFLCCHCIMRVSVRWLGPARDVFRRFRILRDDSEVFVLRGLI
jgi:hypothetical protein